MRNWAHEHQCVSGQQRRPFDGSGQVEPVAPAGRGYEDAGRLYLFLNQVGWTPKDVDPATIPDDLREAHLDRGERDTLALALTSDDALVLMDETAGREVARAQGLPVRGSLGVLIESYRRQLLEADQLRLYFAEVASRRDIWASRALVERLLQEVLGD